MDRPAVETTDLVKRFGTVTALDSLSLAVDPGELYGFLGPNGAGKSTTINVLTGQLRPDEGSARVLAIDPEARPVDARTVVGILPENGRPPSFLTVREYFEFVAAVRNVPDLEAQVDEWADRLEFAHKLDTLCTDLSQGERQKVLLTQAFIHEPDVVFIDEPLTNLDPIMQERVKQYLEEYRRRGKTVFLSTHFVATAEEICTRVGIINRGQLLAELDPRELSPGESLLDRFFAAVDSDASAVSGDPAAPGAQPPPSVQSDGGAQDSTADNTSTGSADWNGEPRQDGTSPDG